MCVCGGGLLHVKDNFITVDGVLFSPSPLCPVYCCFSVTLAVEQGVVYLGKCCLHPLSLRASVVGMESTWPNATLKSAKNATPLSVKPHSKQEE